MKRIIIGLASSTMLLLVYGCFSCGGTTVIDDEKTYSSSWREPNTQEIGSIGRLMTDNNITGCGEFHVKEIESLEFVIACTSTGKSWTYYVAYPNTGKIYLASVEMEAKLTPPY